MKPGALKRLWLVVSIPWTLFFGMFLQEPRGSGDQAVVALMLLPWLVCPLILYALRFVLHGTISARPSIVREPPVKVHAEWED